MTPVLRRILVPLDGSPEAEYALEPAAELAAAAGAGLVRVRTADNVQPTGLRTDIAAPRGTGAVGLLAEIAHQEPDLIVMTAHRNSGRGGTSPGALAESIIAAGPGPVLLVRYPSAEHGTPPRKLAGRKVLVLLDGSALAEAALPIAFELARVLHTELVLFKSFEVYSVPYAVPADLMTIPDVDVQLAWDGSFDAKESETYLAMMTKRLNRQSPGTVVQTHVQAGDLIEQVVAFESAADIGVIVMGTHGRSRLAETVHGSTFHDVLHATACPVLVLHPHS